MDDARSRLSRRWDAVTARAGLASQDRIRDEVLRAYAEDHRRYHTLAHLEAVLAGVDVLAPAAAVEASHRSAHIDADAVALAAFLHDLIYDTAAADNEERSAVEGLRHLADMGAPAGMADEVARLVRLTATHDPADNDINGRWLCDADLLILAADEARYRSYSAQIREEYAAVPDDQFAAGREQVLRTLANGGPLFTLADMSANTRAFDNIGRELAELSQ